MNRRGVSMILEYLLLASILSVFVFTVSLTLNDVLERSQLERVIDNQFADIASEVSSQLVDILAVYPSNGNMTVKVFMPEKIGDIEYIVGLEGNNITIESDDGRFSKYLSIGAAYLKLQNLSGFTHSLKEAHQLQYSKTSCVFPSAVLSVRPSAIIVPGNFTIDSSASSSGSGTTYEWRVKWWNGTWSGWYPQSVNQIRVEINNGWNPGSECNYNNGIYECEIVLEVRTTCQSKVLNDTDVKTVLIANQTTTGGTANLSVDKFVKPPQAGPGDTVELHIRLDGKGISGGRTVNLSVVLALDSSGSMGDISGIYGENGLLSRSTLFEKISGTVGANKRATNLITLPSNIEKYQFVVVEIADSYKDSFWVYKIGSSSCPSLNCECFNSRRICYVENVPAGDLEIEIEGADKNTQYEALVYIQKLDSLKNAAIEYLNGLEPSDFAGLVEYNNSAVAYDVNVSSVYLKKLTTDKSEVVEKVNGMVAGGATNVYHALWKANQSLFENTTIIDDTIPLIILMTDGKPTVEAHVSQSECSGSWFTEDGVEFCRYGWWCTDNCYKQIEDLAEQIKQNKIGDENIRICTIGFGRPGDYNATLLENIASYINQTTKCFFTAQTAEQLQKAFRTIAQSFEVVATDVNITDVIPSNVDVGSVTVETDGSPVCDATPKKMNDASGNTTVKFNCSEIHIDDVVELVIQIKAYEPGWYQLDVPDVSNVTYTDINNNLRTVNLEVVQVVYGKPSKAKVWIE